MRIETPADMRNPGQADNGAGRTEHGGEAKRDPAEPKPGDFYWHEDTPPMPLGRGILIAARHMLGMSISPAPKQHGKAARRSDLHFAFRSKY
jgi:hypothetical protein